MNKYEMNCFLDEFNFLKTITHPNVVRVFDLKEDSKAVYLIMEYLNGPNLALELEQVYTETGGLGLDEDHARDIFLKWVFKNVDFNWSIADGLSEVHRLNYLHRDIKPENIVRHYPEEAQDFPLYKIGLFFLYKYLYQIWPFKLILVDFNFAKKESESETNLGTFFYAAPEVYKDDSTSHTKKIDIWSLGVILYEM